MWTMTPTSFTSAVVHRDDPSLLMVRSRDRASLTTLAAALGYDEDAVYTSYPSDYPFRLVVAKVEYAEWLRDQAMKINYDNFKAQAATERRDHVYLAFLHEVWVAGHALTDGQTRAGNDAAWTDRDRDLKQTHSD